MDDEILKKQAEAIEKIMKMIPFRASEVTPMKEYDVPHGYKITPPSKPAAPFPTVLQRNGTTVTRTEYECGALLEVELNGANIVAIRCNRSLQIDHITKTVSIDGPNTA